MTTSEALDAARRKKHDMEGKALGITEYAEEHKTKPAALHIAVKRYLAVRAGERRSQCRRHEPEPVNFGNFVESFAIAESEIQHDTGESLDS